MREYLIFFFISLCITMTVYLAFPISCVIRKKTYNAKKIRRIAVINAIVGYIILAVLVTETGGTPSGGGFVLWSWVGYVLLKKNCLEKPQDVPVPADGDTSNLTYCPHCYKYISEESEYCPYCAAPVSHQRSFAKILLVIVAICFGLILLGVVLALLSSI